MNTAGVKQLLSDYLTVARLRLVVKEVEHSSARNEGGKHRRIRTGSRIVTLAAGSIPCSDSRETAEKINKKIKESLDAVFLPLMKAATHRLNGSLESAKSAERLFETYCKALEMRVAPQRRDACQSITPHGLGEVRFDESDFEGSDTEANVAAKMFANEINEEFQKLSADILLKIREGLESEIL